MHVYVYVYLCAHMYVYTVCMYVCMHVCMCVRIGNHAGPLTLSSGTRYSYEKFRCGSDALVGQIAN